MGGYARHGRLPPKLFLHIFYDRNFGGEPPIPLIVSILSFSFFYIIIINNNKIIMMIKINKSYIVEIV
jgi:hypothetical protein